MLVFTLPNFPDNNHKISEVLHMFGWIKHRTEKYTCSNKLTGIKSRLKVPHFIPVVVLKIDMYTVSFRTKFNAKGVLVLTVCLLKIISIRRDTLLSIRFLFFMSVRALGRIEL